MNIYIYTQSIITVHIWVNYIDFTWRPAKDSGSLGAVWAAQSARRVPFRCVNVAGKSMEIHGNPMKSPIEMEVLYDFVWFYIWFYMVLYGFIFGFTWFYEEKH